MIKEFYTNTWNIIYWLGLRNFFFTKKIINIIEFVFFKERVRAYFDLGYYLKKYDDIPRDYSPDEALKHFIIHGACEGRKPSQHFDTVFYKNNHCVGGYNPISHFILFGITNKLSANPYYDHEVYIAANQDLKNLENPFEHFIKYGIKENRRSGNLFDAGLYLRINPDVAEAGIPALSHYMAYGISEGRRPNNSTNIQKISTLETKKIYKGSFEKILKLKKQTSSAASLDIIIPVYGASAETMNCLYSVLTSKNKKQFKIIVIDDASPDKNLSQQLKVLSQKGYIKLLVNKKNKGFVASVNRGMKSSTKDVILLNSDTEVYHDWVDRLSDIAASNQDISTVTPISNNATIFSYPIMNNDTHNLKDISFKKLDFYIKKWKGTQFLEVPTGHGFCIFIKRKVLKHVGYFDEKTFGLGYGEENDFCLRSQALGYKDVVALNTFVRHFGSSSFKGKKLELVKSSIAIIKKKYPYYENNVLDFINRDPLHEIRVYLDEQRLKNVSNERNILIISHTRGGGTEQHVQEETTKLIEAGYSCFILSASNNNRNKFRLYHSNVYGWNLKAKKIESFQGLLKFYKFKKVLIHHLVDFNNISQSKIISAIIEENIDYEYMIHDYYNICPQINLISNKMGMYCNEPGVSSCNKCLKTNPSETRALDIIKWRKENNFILSKARAVFVPNLDVKQRINKYFPNINITVKPHENLTPEPKTKKEKPDTFNIGIIGAISNMKGLDIIKRCSRKINKDNIKYTVIGYTSDDKSAIDAGINISGRYDNENVYSIINENKLDAIFIPSTWPETYSYTLSIALNTGLPIIVFDIGAPANRLRSYKNYPYLIIELHTKPFIINKKIVNFLELYYQKEIVI